MYQLYYENQIQTEEEFLIKLGGVIVMGDKKYMLLRRFLINKEV